MISYLTISNSSYINHVAVLFHSLLAQGKDELFWGEVTNNSVHLKRISRNGIELIRQNVAQTRDSDTIVESCTRFRPLLLETVFDVCGCEIGCYIDPDIYVYGTFDELLDPKYSIWITPHLVLKDLTHASDPVMATRVLEQAFSLLRWGGFNLGLYFVRNDSTGRTFLSISQSLLDRSCTENSLYGFVDQKWMDFLISIFPSEIKVITHSGLNLSYWNVPYRTITKEGPTYWVNGMELKAFHYSGVGTNYVNCNYGTNPLVNKLISAYQGQLLANEGSKFQIKPKLRERDKPYKIKRTIRNLLLYALEKTESK